jgi:hypothetical protein
LEKAGEDIRSINKIIISKKDEINKRLEKLNSKNKDNAGMRYMLKR